jgi:FKBP-type peptidyl-prolyl cis-trans isomerase 2
MQTAKSGDKVSVHYRGTLEDGSEFDSSAGGDPLEFTVGAGQVIRGFDEAVIGMQVGDRKQERIPSDRAYGEYNPDLVFDVDRANLPADSDLEVGDIVEISFENGESAPVRIAELTDDTLKLDANHPLAGKTLIFDVELVGIS